MYLALRLMVVLSLVLPTQAAAQRPTGVLLPVGARMKAEAVSSPSTIEGTLLARHADTLIVATQGRDTVRLASGQINKLRVVESPTLWQYTSVSDINYYAFPNSPRGTGAPRSDDPYSIELLVATTTALVGIDPGTGTPLWTRQDLPDVKGVELDIVSGSGYGIITRRDTMTIVDIGTGTVRWRQDSLFGVEPRLFNSGGVSYLFGNQPPFADSDSTFVLYLSSEGPLRLHKRSGAVLWRGAALRTAKVPATSDGWAFMRSRRGTLFVPSGDSLLALRTSDGQPLWPAPHKFTSRVNRMETTTSGLLVRGEKWLDLLDPATGRSVWPAPIQLKNATGISIRGDTTYVEADKKVLAIRISDGTVRTIATVSFKEGESPWGMGVWTEGLVLYSWHNLMLVDRQGATRYHHVYRSPKESFGEALRNGAGANIMRPTTRWAGSHVFFFTGEPDDAGHEGFSIVKIDPGPGRETARVWFDKRVPSYSLEPASSRAYYQRDDRTIEAMPFPDGDALAHAARYGQSAALERLLAMGIDPNLADAGWTALHYAARAGRGSVVGILIRAGASVNAATDEGWTPWMLAARAGHDSVARALREAGAHARDAVSWMLNGWRLAYQEKIAEALTALKQASAQDSTLPLWPGAWNAVCGNGALAGQAAAVLTACDKAVQGTPAAAPRFFRVHLSRGIVRALTGDLAGAAADLEACSTCQGSDDEDNDLRVWLDALHDNRNPFTPAVLASLRGTR